MQKSSVLIILVAFVLGIIVAQSLKVHWIVLFTIWIGFLFSLIVITAFRRKKIFFRSWINWNIILLFFLSGMLGYSINQPDAYYKEYSAFYLEGDYLIGEVIEFQKGDGAYDKAIIDIKQVVRPSKEVNVQGKLVCYIRSEGQEIAQGNVILFQPKILQIKNKNNPGEFNAEKYWKVKGIDKISFVSGETIEVIGQENTFSGFWTRSRNHLIGIIQKHISEENQGLVIALSLGDKSNLSNEKRDHFANAGAMHVLAVSGMHVGILLAFIQFIFKQFKFLRKRSLYLIFGIVFLWCFAFITGMPASVTRAVTMFSILALGQLMGKKFFSLQAIFASALVLLIFDPMLLYDIGFQLSYLAVISISLFYLPILSLFRFRYKIIGWFWEGTAIGIAAQIGTVPLSLFYFNQFPNYFFLSNIGLLIIAAVALNGVVIFLLLHFIPYVVDALAYAVNFIFDVFNGFISWINTLPAVVSTGFTPQFTLVLTLYFGIVFSLFHWQRGNIKRVNLGVVLLFFGSLLLVFNRELNKSRVELVVLNHYEKVILLKSNHQLFLLYNGKNKSAKSNLKFLTHGYENAAGIVATEVYLPSHSSVYFSDEIQFTNEKNGIKINYFDHQLFLANTVKNNDINTEYKVVKGDWNPYLPEEDVNINTQNGALIIQGK